MKWQVETKPDVFESVKSPKLRISGGCLIFYRHDGMRETVELAYAQSQWITVHEEKNES